jgi:hypothetical protein
VIDMLSTPLPTYPSLIWCYVLLMQTLAEKEKQQIKLRLQSVPHVRQRAGLQL